MKFVSGLVVASAKHVQYNAESPMVKVVELLKGLQERVEKDGDKESAMYDKVKNWCDATLKRKSKDIDTAGNLIEELSAKILKLEAEVAVHKAEIKSLNKNIAANENSQKEAEAAREKENLAYIAFKTEGEQALGALKTAIKVLTGAGAGKDKANFLAIHGTELANVAAGVRKVLSLEPAASLPTDDVQAVIDFVNTPANYVQGRHEGAAAVQVSNNPFGDYAPQSTRIQGILKGMADTFTENLEKASKEEAAALKSFDELSAIKKAELKSLSDSLDDHTKNLADKGLDLSTSHQKRDETEAQMKADKKFFVETKLSCQDKARQWEQRSKIRSEEIASIERALKVLSSDESMATFKNAAETFLQTQSVRTVHKHDASRSRMFNGVVQNHPELAELAIEAQMTGHFDKVIWAIDKMIAAIREEEADDIAHRDRCQNSVKDNENDAEDLDDKIKKSKDKLAALKAKASALRTEVEEQESAIKSTKSDMADALSMRNSENKAFQTAVGEDRKAVELIAVAIHELEKFYIQNGISLKLLQGQPSDKMPDAPGPGEYRGRKTDTAPILGMLAMIKEDLEKEIKTTSAEDAKAQSDFERERAAMGKTLEKQMISKASSEKSLARTETEIADEKSFLSDREADLKGNGEEAKVLETDCDWVKTHFETRRQKRKAELDGLVDAKNFLAGGGE